MENIGTFLSVFKYFVQFPLKKTKKNFPRLIIVAKQLR